MNVGHAGIVLPYAVRLLSNSNFTRRLGLRGLVPTVRVAVANRLIANFRFGS